MKIDVTQVIKNLKGEDMFMLSQEIDKNGQSKRKRSPMVFREAVTNLLNTETQQHLLTAEDKNKAFQIMKKIWDSKVVDLTVDDRAFIKKKAFLFYPPMTAGVISEALEEKS